VMFPALLGEIAKTRQSAIRLFKEQWP